MAYNKGFEKTTIYGDMRHAHEEHRKIKCIGYSRVSTKHEEQYNSLCEQRKAIEDFVANHDELVLVANLYEQASGSNDLRDEYQELLQNIRSKQVEYIIVKDDARLNRSVENSMRLIKALYHSDVKIHFLMSGMTYDTNDHNDIRFLEFNAMANEFVSYNQSEKARYAHMKKIETKRLSRQNECYGYRYNKEEAQMEIEPFEGEIIKKIFHKFVYEDKGVTTISRELFDLGVHGFGNNLYLSPSAILKYLRSSCYYGDMTFNHRNSAKFEIGHGAKAKRYFTSKDEYVHVQVPPIITKELFDLAQRKLAINKEDTDLRFEGTRNNSKFKGTHLFSTKIVCGDCGNVYYFREGGRVNKYCYYTCSQKKRVQRKNKNKTINEIDLSSIHECKNPYGKIMENALITIVREALSISKDANEECFTNIEDALNYSLSRSRENNTIVEKLRKTLVSKEKEKEKMINNLAFIDDVDVITIVAKKIKDIALEIEHCKNNLEREQSTSLEALDIKERMAVIKESLQAMKNIDELTQDEVQRYVDKIKVENDGTIDVYLNFGNTYVVKYDAYIDVPTNDGGDIAIFPTNKALPNVGNIVIQDAPCS